MPPSYYSEHIYDKRYNIHTGNNSVKNILTDQFPAAEGWQRLCAAVFLLSTVTCCMMDSINFRNRLD